MSFDFDKHAIKGNEFVLFVGDELNVSREMAGGIMRAVFHAMRNCLTHEESFQLLAQLPMALKGMYVDGWMYDKDFNPVLQAKDFIKGIKKEDEGLSGYDFDDDANARVAVAAVFKALSYFISEEEMNVISHMLPADLKQFIKKQVSGKGMVF